jgi:hypothetical protein
MDASEIWSNAERRFELLDGKLERLLASSERLSALHPVVIERLEKVERDLGPVKTHVAVVGAFSKIVGVVAGVVAIFSGVAKLKGWI